MSTIQLSSFVIYGLILFLMGKLIWICCIIKINLTKTKGSVKSKKSFLCFRYNRKVLCFKTTQILTEGDIVVCWRAKKKLKIGLKVNSGYDNRFLMYCSTGLKCMLEMKTMMITYHNLYCDVKGKCCIADGCGYTSGGFLSRQHYWMMYGLKSTTSCIRFEILGFHLEIAIRV